MSRVADHIPRLGRIDPGYFLSRTAQGIRSTRHLITEFLIYRKYKSRTIRTVCQTGSSCHIRISDKLAGKCRDGFSGIPSVCRINRRNIIRCRSGRRDRSGLPALRHGAFRRFSGSFGCLFFILLYLSSGFFLDLFSVLFCLFSGLLLRKPSRFFFCLFSGQFFRKPLCFFLCLSAGFLFCTSPRFFFRLSAGFFLQPFDLGILRPDLFGIFRSLCLCRTDLCGKIIRYFFQFGDHAFHILLLFFVILLQPQQLLPLFFQHRFPVRHFLYRFLILCQHIPVILIQLFDIIRLRQHIRITFRLHEHCGIIALAFLIHITDTDLHRLILVKRPLLRFLEQDLRCRDLDLFIVDLAFQYFDLSHHLCQSLAHLGNLCLYVFLLRSQLFQGSIYFIQLCLRFIPLLSHIIDVRIGIYGHRTVQQYQRGTPCDYQFSDLIFFRHS